MKILQVSKKFPHPPKDGESVAILQMSKSLAAAGCQVSLLAMNTTRHFVDIGENIAEELHYYQYIRCVKVDNRIHWRGALRNLFSTASYHVTRFVSEDFRKALVETLHREEFDIIQLETPYLAPYLPEIKANSNALVVLRAHNIEHEIWMRIANQVKFLPKKFYLAHLGKKLRNFELSILNDYDFLVAITDRDLVQFRSLGYKNGCVASPVGLNFQQYLPDYSAFQRTLTLSFIGSLDWLPNAGAVRWFLQEVWPEVHAEMSDVEFHFAGRKAPADLIQLNNPGVHYHPEVVDARAFMLEYQVMVVPIFAGSGMRVKILEAMALGRVVITTSIGLEGINARHKEEVIIANSVADFIESIRYCKENPQAMQKMGERAHRFVVQHFDSNKLGTKLMATYRKVLSTHARDNQELSRDALS
jgi:glycosyltransferase involved in cell wall biosynthesis